MCFGSQWQACVRITPLDEIRPAEPFVCMEYVVKPVLGILPVLVYGKYLNEGNWVHSNTGDYRAVSAIFC